MINACSAYAFKEATSAGESIDTINVQGETLVVQVSGTATAVNLSIMGKVDFQQDAWFPITGINRNGFSSVTNIVSPGIYEFPIAGLSHYKFILTAVNGGNVSVYFRACKGD